MTPMTTPIRTNPSETRKKTTIWRRESHADLLTADT
jgi:hypothetical protein